MVHSIEWECQIAAHREATSTVHATWKVTIGPPHHCGPHPDTSHLTGGPHHSATWQTASGPHQLALAK
jgi:hypothetical protein